MEPPTITSSDAATFAIDQADSFTVTTTPGNDQDGDGLVSLSESGPLPDDVTFTDNGDGTATLAGTPPDGSGGTYSITISAFNGVEPDATQNFMLTVEQPGAPTSVTINGPDSQVVGTAYEANASSSGGDVAPTYTLASGAPSWLSIDPSSGDISGTIPEGNPPYYGYSVTATNPDGSATSSEEIVSIDNGSTTVSLGAAPGETVPAKTSVTFTATINETEGSGALSGTVSFTMTKGSKVSSLCSNISPSGDTASCTVPFPKVGNFTVTAAYANDPFFNGSSDAILEQVVSATTPIFTSASDTTTSVGSSFSFDIGATGNPVPTISISGVLPAGIVFQAGPAGSATISGTAASGTGGSYAVTFTAKSSAGTTSQNFTLKVDEAAAITSASSTSGTAGLNLSFKVKTSGYPAATVSETGNLPSGVVFRAKSNGSATISGTPASGTGGSYPLTITASNGMGSPSTQDFVLTINQGPVFTSAPGTSVTEGTSFDFPVTVNGSPEPNITETGALPSGVSFEQGLPGMASITGVCRRPHRRQLHHHPEGKGQRGDGDPDLHPDGR